MKRLSSGLTFIHRRVYPIFFGGISGLFFLLVSFGALRDREDQPPPWYVKWIILTIGGVATTWGIIEARRIQEVEMDGENIRVNGSRGSDKIPLTSIWAIEETRLRNPKLIILHISPECRYGQIIRFIPTGSGRFLDDHPVVAEIERAKKAACENAMTLKQ